MILLANRALVKISGEDALKFLQGLITNNIEKLTAQNALYAALLSPQGKYLFDFLIYEVNGSIMLDVAKYRAGDLIKKLNMYKLRAKVEITAEPDFNVYHDLEEGVSDPRSIKLGKRSVTDEEQLEDGSPEDYERLRLEVGVPDSADLVPEESFIMQNNFEELNGIDFEKGCYVGQEIVARTKYKGIVRRRLYRALGKANLPPFGSKIKDGEKTIGEMRSSINNTGLAQCEIEQMIEDKPYDCEGKQIILEPLNL